MRLAWYAESVPKKILDRSSTWGFISQLLLAPLSLDAQPDAVDDAVFRI